MNIALSIEFSNICAGVLYLPGFPNKSGHKNGCFVQHFAPENRCENFFEKS